MRYKYDGFNRIRSMEYPDGEKVSYSYDSGGQLYGVGSRKGDDTTTYINRIYYNSQGLRRDVFYGNDVVSTYSYDSLQRLNCLTSRYGGGCMQNILYSYDQAGNIVSVTNTADVCDNGLGGTYTNTYKYDDLYRLVNSNGSSNDISSTSYNLDMEYSPAGRIIRKFVDANVSTSPNGVEHILKDCHYTYHLEQPHTVKEVINQASYESQRMLWDANGNLTLSSAKDPRDDRKLCWTEENRLAAVADGNYISHYRYDADGERVLKLWGYTFPMDVNAGENRFAELKEFTVYLSPYVVADVNGYTKHYYAGMERLCCRIGGGGLQDLHEFQVPDSLVKEKENANLQMLKEDLTCAGARAETKGLYFEVLNRFIENLSPEEGIYYYHPDHLGSASWITDRNGRPIQHMQYLPYGETKLDQRTSSYNERYTFTGKEKDSETGYYYFGVRYYNSDLSLWLSVDPMSDKYPSLSPYNYCAWNPMKLVDPDGTEINPVYDLSGYFLGTDDRGLQGDPIIMERSKFHQNMSHADAVKSEANFSEMLKFCNSEGFSNFFEHSGSLSSRPDWDGKLTLSEANEWYRNGNGAPLYVDLKKIDLSTIVSLGEEYVNQKKTFNLLLCSGSVEDGLVFGNITLKRYPNHSIRAYSDNYGFEMKNWNNPLNWGRNIETLIGSWVAGKGVPYDIHIYGSTQLRPILPWIK